MTNYAPRYLKDFLLLLLEGILFLDKNELSMFGFMNIFYLYDKVCYVSHTIIK